MRSRFESDGIPSEVIITHGDEFAKQPTKLVDFKSAKWVAPDESCQIRPYKVEQQSRDEPDLASNDSESNSNSSFQSSHSPEWNPINLNLHECEEISKQLSGMGIEQWCQYHAHKEEEEIRQAQNNKLNVDCGQQTPRIENIQLERQFKPDEYDVVSDDSVSCSQSIFESHQVDSSLWNSNNPLHNLNSTPQLPCALEPLQLSQNHADNREQQSHKETNRAKANNVESEAGTEKEGTKLAKDFEPGPWDVICGRGKHSLKHVGNQRFRVLLAIHVRKYIEASCRDDKSNVIDLIVNVVRDASPSGGFVRHDAKGNWYKLGPTLARKKVSHALRDWTVEHRRKGKCSSVERNTIILDAQNAIFESLYFL